MKFANSSITWFDLLLAGLVIFGILRGRKRGMSEELLDVCQWLCIVVVGALVYKPLGIIVTRYTSMSNFYGPHGSFGKRKTGKTAGASRFWR